MEPCKCEYRTSRWLIAITAVSILISALLLNRTRVELEANELYWRETYDRHVKYFERREKELNRLAYDLEREAVQDAVRMVESGIVQPEGELSYYVISHFEAKERSDEWRPVYRRVEDLSANEKQRLSSSP